MRRVLAPALMSAVVLLTGCVEEPAPKVVAEPSPSTQETGDPTPQRETVREFLVRWAELERDMQNTGETDEYRAITEGCEPCTSLADDMEEVYAAGGFLRTDGMTVGRVRRLDPDNYLVAVDIAPTEYSKSASGPRGSFDGGRVLYHLVVVRGAAGWNLSELYERAK